MVIDSKVRKDQGGLSHPNSDLQGEIKREIFEAAEEVRNRKSILLQKLSHFSA